MGEGRCGRAWTPTGGGTQQLLRGPAPAPLSGDPGAVTSRSFLFAWPGGGHSLQTVLSDGQRQDQAGGAAPHPVKAVAQQAQEGGLHGQPGHSAGDGRRGDAGEGRAGWAWLGGGACRPSPQPRLCAQGPPGAGGRHSRHDLLDVEVSGPVLLDARHVAHAHDTHHHRGHTLPGLSCGGSDASAPAWRGRCPGSPRPGPPAPSPSEERGSSRRRAAWRSM